MNYISRIVNLNCINNDINDINYGINIDEEDDEYEDEKDFIDKHPKILCFITFMITFVSILSIFFILDRFKY